MKNRKIRKILIESQKELKLILGCLRNFKNPCIIISSLLLTSFINCSSLGITKSERPENIPKTGIWDKDINRWILHDVTGVYIWYPNGQIARQAKKLYGKDESLIAWYENGNKEMDGLLKNNLKEGLWQFWYPNGQLQMKGYYVNDKEDGFWEGWDENGEKLGETIYKDGVKISEKDFSKK